MPQKISAQNVCPSPKVWDFWKKALPVSVVRALRSFLVNYIADKLGLTVMPLTQSVIFFCTFDIIPSADWVALACFNTRFSGSLFNSSIIWFIYCPRCTFDLSIITHIFESVMQEIIKTLAQKTNWYFAYMYIVLEIKY